MSNLRYRRRTFSGPVNRQLNLRKIAKGASTMLDDDTPFDPQTFGLRGDWEKDDDERYVLVTAWWQSFSVVADDGEWTVYHYDHDAGIDANNELVTSCDAWDDRYPTWLAAAQDIEARYLRKD